MADATDQAAARRETALKAAADQLAAQRAAEDEAAAKKRLDEDEALADKRTAEDRVLASSRARLSVAATAVQAAVTAVSDDAEPDDPHTADLRAAHAEMQAALAEHLDLAPDQPDAPDQEAAGRQHPAGSRNPAGPAVTGTANTGTAPRHPQDPDGPVPA